MNNNILKLASDTTWGRMLEKARKELSYISPAPPTAAQKKKHDQLYRAVYGPPPPPANLSWLLTRAPFPEFRRVIITPDQFARLLDTMVTNRNEKPKKIAQFARQMLQGRFPFTNLCMAINSEGQFQDGMNRALASILVDTPLDTGMFVGMPVDNYQYLDQGTPRSGKDTFDIDGETNTLQLSTATRMMLQVEQWRERTHLMAKRLSVANDELHEAKERYGDPLRDGVSVGFRIYSHVRTSVGAMACAYCLVRRVAPIEAADEFFESLAKGTSSKEPANVVRNHFLARKREYDRKDWYKPYTQLAMVIRAWNAHVEGRKPSLILFDSTNKFPHEPLPWSAKSGLRVVA